MKIFTQEQKNTSQVNEQEAYKCILDLAVLQKSFLVKLQWNIHLNNLLFFPFVWKDFEFTCMFGTMKTANIKRPMFLRGCQLNKIATEVMLFWSCLNNIFPVFPPSSYMEVH